VLAGGCLHSITHRFVAELANQLRAFEHCRDGRHEVRLACAVVGDDQDALAIDRTVEP
jgi:hypothetical protein